jgi:very-short-patch-repair endonuclease
VTTRAATDMDITFTGGPRRSPSENKLDFAHEMRRDPTPGEAALWIATKRIRRRTRINRQQVIRGFIADFYLPAQRAIIEVDGGYHLDDEQIARDERRDGLFHDWGYSILRLADELVVRSPSVCADILEQFIDEVGEYRFRPGVTPTWRFSGYGLLRHYDRDARRWVVEHWFDAAVAPDDAVCEFGDPDGIDYHALSDCARSRCVEWAR